MVSAGLHDVPDSWGYVAHQGPSTHYIWFQLLVVAGASLQAQSPLQDEIQAMTIIRQAFVATDVDTDCVIIEGDYLGAVRRLRRLWEMTLCSRGGERRCASHEAFGPLRKILWSLTLVEFLYC